MKNIISKLLREALSEATQVRNKLLSEEVDGIGDWYVINTRDNSLVTGEPFDDSRYSLVKKQCGCKR